MSEKQMSNKVLADYHPAPTGGEAPVAAITHQQLLDALDPLMALLGTSPGAVMAGSLEIRLDEWRVSFVSCVPVAGVEPIVYGGDKTDADGTPYAAIWAWPVTVEVIRP